MKAPEATASGIGAERGGFVRNLATLRRRLGRSRDPWSGLSVNRHVRLVGAGAVIAALLIVLSVTILDIRAVGWARGLPETMTGFFRSATRFGKSDWLLIPAGVCGLALLVADWTRVERRIAAAWAEIGAFVLFFFLAVAGSGLTTDLVKWIVGRSRPGRFDVDGILTFTPFSSDAVFLSFPSGHATTAAAAALAVILMMRRFRWAGLTLLALAAVVAVSRIAVRAHFPSDVIGGIFVGATFTYGLAYALGRAGVGFQRQRDGWLLPKTIAVRRILRRRGGTGTMGHALVLALLSVGRQADKPAA